jgi:hypothetical protein
MHVESRQSMADKEAIQNKSLAIFLIFHTVSVGKGGAHWTVRAKGTSKTLLVESTIIPFTTHYHIICYSTSLRVMLLRKLNIKQKRFVAWLFTVDEYKFQML